MSQMEFAIGTFRKTKRDVRHTDTDEHYELENELGCIFVNVDEDVYEVHPIPGLSDLDPYGFQITIDQQHLTDPVVMGYWYNGGGGWHEVAEEAIRNHLKG